MPKYYIPTGIKCPQFIDCSHQMIRCTGYAKGVVQHVAFANRTDYIDHRTTYCAGQCDKCPYRHK